MDTANALTSSFPITYPIVTTAVNYISRFLLTREGNRSEVRGQMKSAVFYFVKEFPTKFGIAVDYDPVFQFDESYGGKRLLVGHIRTEIVDGDDQAALDHAMKNARPGETVLNSVLLEE